MTSRGAGHRRNPSASTHQTKYSIDFDALRGGAASDASSMPEVPRQEPLDVIHSDDIDGPTDFTQNLEYWMNAPLTTIASQRPTVTEPVQIMDNEMAEDLEEYIGSDEQDPSTKEHLSQDDASHKDGEEDNADRRSSVSSLEHQERVLSYLDTLADAEVPSFQIDSPNSVNTVRKAKSTRSLQPTVEDAETTPHKPTYNTLMTPQKSSNGGQTHKDESQSVASLQEQLLKQTMESSDIIKALRESLAITSEKLEQSQRYNEIRFQEMQSARSENEAALQNSNAQWAAQLKPVQEENINEIARLELSVNKEKQGLRDDLKVLGLQLENERKSSAQVHEELRTSNSHELQRQKDEFENRNASQEERISSLQSQLATTRAEKHASQESARSVLAEEVERQAEELGQKFTDQQELITKQQMQLEQSRQALASARASFQEELEQERSGFKATASKMEEQLRSAQSALSQQQVDVPKSSLTLHDPDYNGGSQVKIAELEARLSTTQAQLENTHRQLTNKEQEVLQQQQRHTHSEELYTLSQTKIADLESGMAGLRDQLDQARKEMQAAREDATDARQSLRKEQKETERIRSQFFTRTADWEDEREKLMNKQREQQAAYAELEEEMLEKDIKHKAAMDSLRTRAADAVNKVKEMFNTANAKQKKESLALKESLERAQTDLREAKTQRADSPQEQTDAHTIARLQSALAKQTEATAKAKAALKASQAELVEFKESTKAVNEKFDSIIRATQVRRDARWQRELDDALKTNNAEWEAKFAKVKKERDELGQAYLHMLGREECGIAKPGEPQKYRYLTGNRGKIEELTARLSK